MATYLITSYVFCWTMCAVPALALLAFTSYTVYLVYLHAKYSHLPGPPLSNFYLGNLPEIRQMYKKNEYTHFLFLEWAEKYGPLYRIFLLHKCMIVPTSRTMIKEFLTKSKYPKSRLVYDNLYSVCGERFMGRGLVTVSDHQKWKEKRFFLNAAFHKRSLKTLIEEFNQVADEWIENLQAVADGTTAINMLDFMSRATLDVLGKLLFHINFNAIQDNDRNFTTALDTVMHGFSADQKDPLLKFKWSQRAFCKKVHASVKFIRQEALTALEQRRAAMATGQGVPQDVLTLLVQCLEFNAEMTMEDAIDEFVTLIMAGQETIANSLSFLLKEAGRNPQICRRLQEEVDRVVGEKTFVSFEDLDQLQYLSNVFSETLRMYPPAPGTARENPVEVNIEGYRIPRGSFLVLSFFIMHRLSQYFPEPQDFNPDRWSAQPSSLFYTYMPFSMGQRGCMGKHFAQIESKVLLSKFLQKFDFTLDPNQSFDIQETATLMPKGGVVMTLRPRDHCNH